MEIETLQKLRTYVPGAIILLGCWPGYQYFSGEEGGMKFFEAFNWVTAGAALVLAYIAGSIYNAYLARGIFNSKSHERITSNIKTRLLNIGRTSPLTDEKRNELLKGRTLMNVFCGLIDSNETLKEKAKLVRKNGVVWGSLADVIVIGTFFAVLYIFWWLGSEHTPFFIWGIVSGILAAISAFVLHPRTEKRHIELGDEQLGFIESHLRDEVQTKVNSL
jgi:hypothetical protein